MRVTTLTLPTQRAFFAAALLLSVVSGCRCGGTTVTPNDGGPPPVMDAGSDAGGPVDSGTPPDAGEPDAGLPPELKINRVLPPRGGSAGGTTVLVEGSAFIRDFATRGTEAKKQTTLKFGSNSVIDFQIIDDETLEAKVPPGRAGLVNVSITNPNGTYNCQGCFTYFDELYATGIAPTDGPLRGGTTVVIDGQGFTSDVEVLFGVQSSPRVTLLPSGKLEAITPRGLAADSVDVSVYNKNGVAILRRAFRYVPDVTITQVTPPTGPLSGGTVVTLTGTGFENVTSVKFGTATATSTTVSSTQLTATAPMGAALGAVDVTVTTSRDAATAKGAFAYVDTAGAFKIYGVVPHVANPGETVTVLGQGLDAMSVTATFGGAAVVVGTRTPTTAVVTVPARGALARRVDVALSDGTTTSTVLGGFTFRLGLATISPTTGPDTGATQVTLAGSNLPADAQVVVGSLAATSVVVSSETALTAATPRGSGGAASDVIVREAADLENFAVLPGAFTYTETLSVGRVQPEKGAVAGGTLVTVLGGGFGNGTTVSFGAAKAKDVKIVDSHTLTCRTPRGNVGSVDVTVERLGQTDKLAGGFSYFDPKSISGGLSGGPLVGTLNITVLDSTQGFYGAPVSDANVMLGIDPNTPFQGLTDVRGQITFSDPALVKGQTVTVFKANYESATVTAVNAENLTVFIARTGGGEPSMGPPPTGVPPSVISGRVTGFKIPRPLYPGERMEARVFVAQTSLYATPPFRAPGARTQEKWQVTVEGGAYSVFTSAGLRAVYAIFGVNDLTTNHFTPFLMGVKRGVTTSPDAPAKNEDIVLDMYLDVTVPVTIDGLLNFPTSLGITLPATNSVYAWLDLGAEGFIPNPNNWDTGGASASSVTGSGASLSFPNFPHLDGSNFIFLNEAASIDNYPVSYYFRRQPGDLTAGVTIGPMLPAPNIQQPKTTFNGTISWTVDPGPVPDIHQVQILKLTLLGPLSVWSMVLPGAETQVTLPAPAVAKLHSEEMGPLFVVIYSSRSPKFAYNQWTYDTLSGVSWSSFTMALSSGFTP